MTSPKGMLGNANQPGNCWEEVGEAFKNSEDRSRIQKCKELSLLLYLPTQHRLPGNAKLAQGLEEIGVGFIPTLKR